MNCNKIQTSNCYDLIEATNKKNNKKVLIKVLNDPTINTELISCFEDEFSFLKNIDSKYILKPIFLDKTDKKISLVYEEFDSQTLSQFIANPLDLKSFFDLSLKICDAIKYLHQNKIVYGFLSSNSILINKNRDIKLINFFELSKNKDLLFTNDEYYRAPEQLNNLAISTSSKTDIYSLGIIFYEMLTGELPFYSLKNKEDLFKNIPTTLVKIIEKMISKSLDDRYSDINFVKADLYKCIHFYKTNDFSKQFDLSYRENLFENDNSNEIIGRDNELKQMYYSLDQVSVNKNVILSLLGNSGVGKSSLINYFLNKNRDNFSNIVKLKLDKYKQNSSYEFLYEALRDLTKKVISEEKEDLNIFREKIIDKLENQGKVLIDIIPELEIILESQPEVEHLNTTESKARFDYLLLKYLELFTQDDKPLCIFIDDIQWADSLTLKWIEKFIISLKNIFIIVSYRNEEVLEDNQINVMFSKLSSLNIQRKNIYLKPINQEIISKLIKKEFNLENVKKASEIIFQKTAGNTFFVKEYIKQLKKDEIIYFDEEKLRWYCDVKNLYKLPVSDNVFEVLSNRILSLPDNVQKILGIASCIGSTFNEKLLKEVYNCLDFNESLIFAIQEDWIILSDEQKMNYSFSHDRMQQAVYLSLKKDNLEQIHLDIGYKILELNDNKLDNLNLIMCVNHLNKSSKLILDLEQKLNLGKLNLEASYLAKSNGDFKSALNFIKTSMAILQNTNDNTLCIDILIQRAECEQLNHNNDLAIEFFNKALKLSNSNIQKANIYELIIKFYTDISNFNKAYSIGYEAIKLFDISIPKSFNKVLFLYDFLNLKLKLRNKDVEDILNLPICDNEEINVVIKILSALLKVAYQIKPELCVALSMKLILLCIKYGITKESVVGFMVFGVIFQGGILCNHDLGDKYSQLSDKMLKKFNNITQYSEVQFVCGYFANSWNNPVSNTEDKWNKAFFKGMSVGDWFHSGCCLVSSVETMFLRGVPFDEILVKIDSYKTVLNNISAKEQYTTLIGIEQNILNIKDKTIGRFDEIIYLDNLKEFESKHFAHYYFINKIICLYLHKQYDEALKFIEQSDSYKKDSRGMYHNTEYYFYKALVYFKLINKVSFSKRINFSIYIKKIKNKYKKWSSLNLENYLAKYKILNALCLQLDKKTEDSIREFEEANEIAVIYGQHNLVYISNMLLSSFFRKRNQKNISMIYKKEALKSFDIWCSIKSTESSNLNPSDIQTLINVTQAISEEKRFDKLLKVLLEELIKNINVQNAVLILNDKKELYVEAYYNEQENSIRVLEKIPYLKFENIVQSISNYVIRTHKAVIVDDLEESQVFFDRDSVIQRKVKSILCVPIVLHSELKGLLYFENSMFSSFFKKDKLELIKHLSGQIAISIENTLSYNELEQKVKERTKSLDLKNEELKKVVEKLDILATLDPLTELKNRRYFDEQFFKECKRLERTNEEMSLIMCDVDFFKNYNDYYGHQKGDECLVLISSILKSVLNRPTDLIARYGGEEFIIVLPNTNKKGAYKIANEILEKVREKAIPHEKSKINNIVTISLGVSASSEISNFEGKKLIKYADESLYKAKALGRNRVV